MQPLDRRQRMAVALWLVLSLVVWNGVYDLLLTRGLTEYVLRRMMHEAGRGPDVQIAPMMDMAVRYAAWVATLWAAVILLAGLWTIRMFSRRRSVEPLNG
jgi:uncharacterized membrane protein SpoIIM required for sporulation